MRLQWSWWLGLPSAEDAVGSVGPSSSFMPMIYGRPSCSSLGAPHWLLNSLPHGPLRRHAYITTSCLPQDKYPRESQPVPKTEIIVFYELICPHHVLLVLWERELHKGVNQERGTIGGMLEAAEHRVSLKKWDFAWLLILTTAKSRWEKSGPSEKKKALDLPLGFRWYWNSRKGSGLRVEFLGTWIETSVNSLMFCFRHEPFKISIFPPNNFSPPSPLTHFANPLFPSF